MSMGLQLDTAVVPDLPRRRAQMDPVRIALLVVAAIVGLAVLRVVSGENDIASSGAIAAAIGLAVPIGMAGLGGLWSERSGVVNIGLEGMMILGCWGSALFALQWGPWMGLVGGILIGMVGGLIHAVATVYFGVDHVVSGVALNLIGPGAAKYLAARCWPQYQGAQSPTLPELPKISIPGVSDALHSLEEQHVFGLSDAAGILAGLTTNMSVATVIAMGLVVVTWRVLWFTPFGLRLRSCGEAPAAAETLGVNVYTYKYVGVLVSGGLAGFGGAYLALVAANIFRDGQTGGRGFIGLAALIFGNWRPGSLAGGALMFGYFDAIQLRGNAIHAVLLAAAIAVVTIGVVTAMRAFTSGNAPATHTGGPLAARRDLVPALAAALSLGLGWYASDHNTPGAVRLAIGLAGVLLLLAAIVLAVIARRSESAVSLEAAAPAGVATAARSGLTGAVVMIGFGLLALWWYTASDSVPSQLTGAAPYFATLLVLALASQNLRMPAADGVIYRKGEAH
ncbi:hypothetical protein KEM60_00866 [Austwickia sp. TVS 96-490-7B]|uniref:ABC transporter permease n=1 Tax=Austwickia sp. TVS 96-490-7B TaxID=2830843 RepID=UPI001C59CBC5|nr:ABC transporter permease [Austwickia sp. TVS 96-490-7B]MBW3084677.1 hypothetical protein [Austwickia sp. TVS 96-490-7B]